MDMQKTRLAVGRMAVIAALAVAIMAGLIGVSQPASVSAARMSCAQAMTIGDSWNVLGWWYFFHGAGQQAEQAFEKAEIYYSYC